MNPDAEPPGAPRDDAPTEPLSPSDRPTRTHRLDLLPSDRLIAGRYLLRQPLGEGGMGTVYLADQVQPVRR
jgi:serine/threonine protein kinase